MKPSANRSEGVPAHDSSVDAEARWAALLHEAKVQEAAGNPEGAEQSLLRAMQGSGGAAVVSGLLAEFLVRQQRDREAAAVYEKWLAVDPDAAPALLGLGLILADYPAFHADSIQRLRAALQRDPTRVAAYRPLANLLLAAGQREEALRWLETWLSTTPEDPAAGHFLAAFGGRPAPERASDDFVRGTFDVHAHHFDDLLRGPLEYRAPELLMEQVLPKLTGVPGRVLDLGCGTGLCGPLLKPHASCLIGVDLSKPMLEQAEARGLYDELVAAELGAYLQSATGTFDLILAADTFVYLGALEEVFKSSLARLAPGAWLAFTVEHSTITGPLAGGFELAPSGRYRHQKASVEEALQAAGFHNICLLPASVRKEAGTAVPSLMVMAQKPAG